MQIGNKLRKVRLNKGFDQGWVASQLGISQSKVSEIESGKRDIKTSLLIQYCDLLEMTISELFENTENSLHVNELNNHDKGIVGVININLNIDDKTGADLVETIKKVIATQK